MATFPALRPSSRSYRPGNYPMVEYSAMSGAKWKRVLGNRRVGMELDLSFANVDDSVAAMVLEHFDGEGGTFRRFTLSPEVFAGTEGGLAAAMQPPPNVRWAYADQPSIDSVFPGVSTVKVKLIGEIDYR